jgi:hypothetical protein
VNIGIGSIRLGCLGEDFGVEQAGFDGPHAPGAPASGEHLFDYISFRGRGRIVDVEEFFEDFVELVGGFGVEKDVAVAGS